MCVCVCVRERERERERERAYAHACVCASVHLCENERCGTAPVLMFCYLLSINFFQFITALVVDCVYLGTG